MQERISFETLQSKTLRSSKMNQNYQDRISLHFEHNNLNPYFSIPNITKSDINQRLALSLSLSITEIFSIRINLWQNA